MRSRKKMLELNKSITYRDRVRGRIEPDKAVHQCLIAFVDIIKAIKVIENFYLLCLSLERNRMQYKSKTITDPNRLLMFGTKSNDFVDIPYKIIT